MISSMLGIINKYFEETFTGFLQVMENLQSHGILVKVMKSHENAICFQKIKRQREKKFEKITDESETGFNLSKNKDKQVFCAF